MNEHGDARINLNEWPDLGAELDGIKAFREQLHWAIDHAEDGGIDRVVLNDIDLHVEQGLRELWATVGKLVYASLAAEPTIESVVEQYAWENSPAEDE